MKLTKLVFILFVSGIFFSCDQNTENTLKSNNFELEAKNGFHVANSLLELREFIVLNSNNKVKSIDKLSIESIKYTYLDGFTFANITYQSEAKIGNIILTNYDLKVNSTKSHNECYSVQCTGLECCIVTMTLPNGVPQFSCGCNGCTMNVQNVPCPKPPKDDNIE